MNELHVSACFSPSIDTDAQSMLKMLLRTIRDIKNGGEMGFSSLLRRSFSVRSGTVVDMGDKDGELRVFMVAGEVSGDSIASRLMASLKKLSPLPIRFSGVGG
jgi:lipid-A-disaccharide synthase